MSFHLFAYAQSLGMVVNQDTSSATDDVYTTVNNHLILTEDVDLLAFLGAGSTLSRQRFGNASLIQYSTQHIPVLNTSTVFTANTQVYRYPGYGLRLPRDEDIILETTTSAAGPANTYGLLWLAPVAASNTYPRGVDVVLCRATASIAAATATTWSSLANIVLDRTLYTGQYTVLDAWAYGSSGVAFRLRFTDTPPINNKQLRPGGILCASTASGRPHVLSEIQRPWGTFHTFTLPQVQVLGNTTAYTLELYLLCAYMGRSRQ